MAKGRRMRRSGSNNSRGASQGSNANSSSLIPAPRIPRPFGSSNLSNLSSIYPPNLKLDVPIQVIGQAILASTGYSQNLDVANLVASFASRFGAVFKEYVLSGVTLELSPIATASAGPLSIYVDEQSSSVPTQATAFNAVRVDLPWLTTQNGAKKYVIRYTPRVLSDRSWIATSATTGNGATVGWLKIWAPTSATGTLVISGSVALNFRGYV